MNIKAPEDDMTLVNDAEFQKSGDSTVSNSKLALAVTINAPQEVARANVIIFGQAGVGKSSLVNMLAGHDVAETSDDTTGCMFESKKYAIDTIPSGPPITLWDTTGLNEGHPGSRAVQTAISNLYNLSRSLHGVNLLVYCVRGRINETTIKNYEMLKTFCEGKVPVALVVTGLESIEDRDAWWQKNKVFYTRAGLVFKDHACVVTTKGPYDEGRYAYEDDYGKSTTAVQAMIARACLPTPWRARRGWFSVLAAPIARMLLAGPPFDSRTLYNALKQNGIPEEDALEVARAYRRS